MSETVEIDRELVEELADNHKEVAKHAYKSNRTGTGDIHHSWARQLNDLTDREWGDVGQ